MAAARLALSLALLPALGFSLAWRALWDTACWLCPLPISGVAARAGGTPDGPQPGGTSCPPGSDLQSSHCTLGEAFEDLDWETEKGLEAVACDTEGFVPPKVMVRPGAATAQWWGRGGGLQDGQGPECLPCPQLISSKVPKAEYIPTIIRRDDPAIIPILYVSASVSGLGGGALSRSFM